MYIHYESLSGRITCVLCCSSLCRHAGTNRDGSDGMVTVCRIGDRRFDSKNGVFYLPSRSSGFSPSAYREVFLLEKESSSVNVANDLYLVPRIGCVSKFNDRNLHSVEGLPDVE